MRYVLASQSPRRQELLGKLGIEFDIEPAAGEEFYQGQTPADTVQGLAAAKAMEIMENYSLQERENLVVIGADTIVVCEGDILGKPKDRAHMGEMMARLQGQTHEVYTGVALCYMRDGALCSDTFAECTQVHMYPMSEAQLASYAANSDGLDKAGGYGIQSDAAIYVSGITGDYHNVVGLPIARMYQEMLERGLL